MAVGTTPSSEELGGRYDDKIQAYHMPDDKDAFFNGFNPFSISGMSGYGIILRFKHSSYCGWFAIEMTNTNIRDAHFLTSITTFDNFPTESGEWRILNV